MSWFDEEIPGSVPVVSTRSKLPSPGAGGSTQGEVRLTEIESSSTLALSNRTASTDT